MLKKIIKWFTVIIILLAILFSATKIWNIHPEDYFAKEIHDTIIVRDTVPDTIVRTKFVPYKVIKRDTVRDTVYFNFSTLSECEEKIGNLYSEYNSVKYYNDTFKNDSSALIILHPVISKNNLDTISGEFINRRPTKIINSTTITESKKNSISVETNIGKNWTILNASYTRQKWEFGIGYETKTESVNFKLGYRIVSW